jgi:N-carbamoyl-L-amino-acid hydrolase
MSADALKAAAAVDEARLWSRQMTMAEIGATAKGGVNRAALSAEDIRARLLMVEWARELGFELSTDGIANLYVRRPGRRPDAPPVVTGSHLDSQPRGGKFDGAYGVVGGFEALEAIARSGAETDRSIEVVAWTNEEGGRFQPGAMGSAIFAGVLPLEEQLGILDKAGISLGEALVETLGSTPDLPVRDFGTPFAAYVEAHIEQGPRLEEAGNTIGIVTGIQGLYWFTVEITGDEAHAGTTPLASRKDALKAATSMVHALEELMADETDTVRFTVGRFECNPGSPSTVPGHALFTIDFRHPEMAVIDRIKPAIGPLCEANARGCAVSVRPTIDNAPVEFDPLVVETVQRHADALALPNMQLPSGAGHDAGHIAELCPTGMIFVPCERGLSHNEAENATPGDLAAGARTLAACLVDLANRGDL